MSRAHPRPLTTAQRRSRQRRVVRLARQLGFVGRVEYRHVYSQTGGAQFGLSPRVEDDLLTVYAEAFERDADTDDFSLAAIIAHERGHQLLARHTRIARMVSGKMSLGSEEVLASLLGALIVREQEDRDSLLGKAVVELLDRGEDADAAIRLIGRLKDQLENLL